MVKTLVCAPSNAAADTIAKRLVEKDNPLKDYTYRLFANGYLSKLSESPVPVVIPSNLRSGDKASGKAVAEVNAHAIICMTISTALHFFTTHSGFVFDYVIVDEAGFVTVPMMMAFFNAILPKRSRKVKAKPTVAPDAPPRPTAAAKPAGYTESETSFITDDDESDNDTVFNVDYILSPIIMTLVKWLLCFFFFYPLLNQNKK